jgi:hypothetical protein
MNVKSPALAGLFMQGCDKKDGLSGYSREMQKD